MILKGKKALLQDYVFSNKEAVTSCKNAYHTAVSPPLSPSPLHRFKKGKASNIHFENISYMLPSLSKRLEKSPMSSSQLNAPNTMSNNDVITTWSHVQTLRGIVSSYAEATTQPTFEDPPPLFNGHADRYFSTHGFQASTLHTIAKVLNECGDCLLCLSWLASMLCSRNNGYLQSLFNLQRKYTTSKVCKTQTKTLCKKIKKTAAEKAACAQQWHQSRETFTKDLQEACQDAQQKDKRQISDWNGWVHLEAKRLNEELGHGERLKAHNITAQTKTTWQKMSSNQQKAAAAPVVQDLEESIAFHDTKKTLKHIERQLLALHACTSTEVALTAVCSNQDHYNPPHIIISSVQGQAAGVPVPCMYYSNFDHFITEKYHIVLEGWPLEKFCSPSDIASWNEIPMLMASFNSNSTCFRKLLAAEFKKWSNDCFNTAVESTLGPATALQDSSLAPPSSPCAPSPLSESPVPPTLTSTVEPVPRDPDTGSENTPPSPAPSTVPAKQKLTDAVEPSTSQCPLVGTFINSGVSLADGSTLMVTGRTRKPCADKGKKQGARAK
ncbi:hypothetical protein B0H34DRAFT_807252 [Crassisporium funariophilum]|nr:hypothetical protein B0H34DRAFT_807252 [Crassisporium funariophilum]